MLGMFQWHNTDEDSNIYFYDRGNQMYCYDWKWYQMTNAYFDEQVAKGNYVMENTK